MRTSAYDRTDVGPPQSGKSPLIQIFIRYSTLQHPQTPFAAVHHPAVANLPNGRIFKNAQHLFFVRKLRACGSLFCKMPPIHTAAFGREQRVGKRRTIGQIPHHLAGPVHGKTFVQQVFTFRRSPPFYQNTGDSAVCCGTQGL